jgi:DNA-directed RNA polymerase subunit RPC12/RpoP
MIGPMKNVKYSETIFCVDCKGRVKMLNARLLELKGKAKATKFKDHGQVEFSYLCVDCGKRATEVRDSEYLHFSEREFCQKKGVL